MAWLPDTNVWIRVLKQPHGRPAKDLTLVTSNTDEFARVPNLRVEEWLHSA
jgi:predicted nucleic acid-binding protein